jgi:hypothetical protein
MNAINVSLSQGKKFNQYQEKIKNSVTRTEYPNKTGYPNKRRLKEGFITGEQESIVQPAEKGYVSVLQNQKLSTDTNSQLNTNELDALTKLQTKYDELFAQYNDIQNTISDSSLETINRTGSSNPYLNKNVRFNNSVICYVTSEGIAKPYLSEDDFNNTAGNNGCPKVADAVIDLPFLSSYIAGSTIPSTPSLIVGSPMVKGESCGQEGKNVYASKLLNNPTSSYIGCYSDKPADKDSITDDERAMIFNPNNINYTTYNECQQYALDNGYQYFGLQNYNQADGTAQCLVSNDLQRSETYGDGSVQTIPLMLWSSNTITNTSNTMTLSPETGITVKNGDQIVFSSNYNGVKFYSDCGYTGQEANAVLGQHPSVSDIGFPNDMLSSIEVPDNFGVVLFKDSLGIPPFKILASGQSESCLDSDWNDTVSSYIAFTNLVSYLMLQDDGNMVIYKGAPEQANASNPVLWASNTNGKQHVSNPTWVASNNTFGRNYLKQGESLFTGQWISSNNGAIKLMMQSDGNLVLYTSDTTPGCMSNDKGRTVGGPWVNAIYQLNTLGDKSVLGNIGYIDSNANLRPYPSSMIGRSDVYDVYPGQDSYGNDIANATVTDESGCQTACNNNSDCAGYVFQATTNTCWLKDSNAYPKGSKTPNASLTLGVRRPQITGSTTCSNEIVDVDTQQYKNYVVAQNMAPDTQCNTALVSQENRIKMDNIQSQMRMLGQEIAAKMEGLYNQDNKVYEKMNMNADQFNKTVAMYKNVNRKIQKQKDMDNIEGMRNYRKREGMLTMADVNEMLTDTDLTVLEANYKYIFWSILAVGLLTVTINIMRK